MKAERFFWICFFLGIFGIHRFITGKYLLASAELILSAIISFFISQSDYGYVLYLSLVVLYFLILIDLYKILTNQFTDKNDKIISLSLKKSDTANFTIRFFAIFIDINIINLISYMVIITIEQSSQVMLADNFYVSIILFNLGFYLLYFCAFGIIYQATPGKMLFKLKITDISGKKPFKTQIIVRYFAYFISKILLMSGFLMVLFRKDKLALHDLIAETKIVYNGC